MGTLHTEHVLLGASFEPGLDDLLAVSSYPQGGSQKDAEKGALLCDLTGSCYLLVSGASAPDLARTALAGRSLGVGEVAFEAALSGDGSTLSVPLVLRTGDHELALLDPSPRGEVLSAWLDFLSRVEQDGTAPFAETRVEGASDMLVALALVGSEARAVLSDYVPASSDLPAPGVVSSLRLDEIPALVACLPRAGGLPEGFLILVPPERARAIWRSLLSFGEIYPVGLGALRELLCDTLPWGELLSTSDVVRYSGSTLRGWSLVRNEGDFVGARELEP